MQKQGQIITIRKDIRLWGTRTTRWSKKSQEVNRQVRKKITGEVVIVPGQKTKHEWDCRFCKKECGTDGDFADHLNRTHWSANSYARHKKNGASSKEIVQTYDCKVKNCTVKFAKNYKGLQYHYSQNKHHKVEELLDAGISAWFYRNNNKVDCIATVNWLAKNNYVAIINKKREVKAS